MKKSIVKNNMRYNTPKIVQLGNIKLATKTNRSGNKSDNGVAPDNRIKS